MTHFLRVAPLWLVVLLAAASAVGVTLLCERALRPRREHADGDGTAVVSLYATTSTVYTVVLAFVVVVVWQQFSEAEARVEMEATRVSNVLRDMVPLSEPGRGRMHDALIEYVGLATTAEWETMAHGRPSPRTAAAYREVWEAAYDYRPATPHEELFYGELVAKLNELGAARRSRLLASRSSIPSLLWALLLTGGVALVAVSTLLPGRPSRRTTAVRGAAAALVSLTLLLIFVLDHPFAGRVRVSPAPLAELTNR